MNSSNSLLKEATSSAKTVKIIKNQGTTYDFKLYPFGERGTYIPPDLTREIVEGLAKSASTYFPEFDYIVSPEPGGHTWGMLTAYFLQKPINILRLSTDLYEVSQTCAKRETAYNENYICYDGFTPGDKILLIDDIISSGSTIRCIVEQLQHMGVLIVGIQAILAKSMKFLKLQEDYKFPVNVLYTL